MSRHQRGNVQRRNPQRSIQRSERMKRKKQSRNGSKGTTKRKEPTEGVESTSQKSSSKEVLRDSNKRGSRCVCTDAHLSLGVCVGHTSTFAGVILPNRFPVVLVLAKVIVAAAPFRGQCSYGVAAIVVVHSRSDRYVELDEC
jgi:hypothetical protein